MGRVDEIRGTFQTADRRRIEVVIPDEAAFEAMRDALGDPVWLVGATWEVLTTNDFKRGRFEDAFGAWAERQDSGELTATLGAAGITVVPMPG